MTTKAHVLRELERWAMRWHEASEQGWSSTSSTERALEMAGCNFAKKVLKLKELAILWRTSSSAISPQSRGFFTQKAI